MENKKLDCEKCNKKITEKFYKIHRRECKGMCPINPIIAELFLSRIYMTMEEKIQGMNCKYCNKELGSRQLENHVYECKKLQVKCPYCAQGIPSQNVVTHTKQCITTFSQSYIALKHTKCCKRITKNQDQSLINTEMQSIIQKLINDLKLPKQSFELSQSNFSTKKVFTQGVCIDNCQTMQQCVFCKVDFINKEDIDRIKCGHSLHPDCYQVWRHKSEHCPQCKEKFSY